MSVDCFSTASVNPCVTTDTPGRPFASKFMRSCKLHDVQEPQSDKPITTTSASSETFWTFSGVATLEFVGLP